MVTSLEKDRKIAAGAFKAQCLRLIDQIHTKKGELVITKRGKPLARLVPYEDSPQSQVFGCMQGSAAWSGNRASPVLTALSAFAAEIKEPQPVFREEPALALAPEAHSLPEEEIAHLPENILPRIEETEIPRLSPEPAPVAEEEKKEESYDALLSLEELPIPADALASLEEENITVTTPLPGIEETPEIYPEAVPKITEEALFIADDGLYDLPEEIHNEHFNPFAQGENLAMEEPLAAGNPEISALPDISLPPLDSPAQEAALPVADDGQYIPGENEKYIEEEAQAQALLPTIEEEPEDEWQKTYDTPPASESEALLRSLHINWRSKEALASLQPKEAQLYAHYIPSAPTPVGELPPLPDFVKESDKISGTGGPDPLAELAAKNQTE